MWSFIWSDENSNLVDWEVIQKRIPWDILLLQGGGFAMAKAAEVCASGIFIVNKVLINKNVKLSSSFCRR